MPFNTYDPQNIKKYFLFLNNEKKKQKKDQKKNLLTSVLERDFMDRIVTVPCVK